MANNFVPAAMANVPAKLKTIVALFIAMAVFSTSACSPNMSRQPRYSPMSASNFFPDGRSERPPLEGTVPSSAGPDNPFNTGRENGKAVARAPVPATLERLQRGRERYDIYCSPCHSRVGNGEGMVVQRGFLRPPTLHSDRLRSEPDGHFFAVITEGFGKMWSYASRVSVPDRWAITLYIRALQLSQSATPTDVPPQELQKLLGAGQ